MPDQDGYPFEEELEKVEKWDFKDPCGLVEFISKIWHWPDFGFTKRFGFGWPIRKKVIKVILHTGGWSGNESIVSALEKNFMFWNLFWQSSERGGHYYFEIPMKREVLRKGGG